jgi:hypothetical protein
LRGDAVMTTSTNNNFVAEKFFLLLPVAPTSGELLHDRVHLFATKV